MLDQYDRKEKEKVLYLIFEINQEGPFTALGLFSIELSTLTSLFSTILTYLIVLVQFNPPGNQDEIVQINNTVT